MARNRSVAAEGGTKRVIVGISGSSGVVYGIRLLEVLAAAPMVETHLVISPAARQTIALETDRRAPEIERLADVSYRYHDIAAAISSGSYSIDSMIVAPCSMKSLAGIAHSFEDNLLIRAAGVTLKERRPLVLVPRESPLHLGYLRLLVQAAEIGAIICPPMPAFYTRPNSIAEIVDHTVLRILDLIDVPSPDGLSSRWNGPPRDAESIGDGG